MLKCDGEYIAAIADCTFNTVMPLTPRAAWEMLVRDNPDSRNHGVEESYPGDEDFRRNRGLVNDGFAVIYIDAHRVTAISTNDGHYWLLCCLQPMKFLDWLERPSAVRKSERELGLIDRLRYELFLPDRRTA